MSLTAEQKVQLTIDTTGKTLQEFLTIPRTKKYELLEALIVFGFDIQFINKHFHIYSRLPRSIDLLEDLEIVNEQLCKREISQDKKIIKAHLDEIELIKKEFTAMKDEVESKEAIRIEKTKQLLILKEELKKPCMEFLTKLNEYLGAAHEIGQQHQNSHLANFQQEFVRYSLLSKEEATNPDYENKYAAQEDD